MPTSQFTEEKITQPAETWGTAKKVKGGQAFVCCHFFSVSVLAHQIRFGFNPCPPKYGTIHDLNQPLNPVFGQKRTSFWRKPPHTSPWGTSWAATGTSSCSSRT
eukprot:EG_transcript_43951